MRIGMILDAVFPPDPRVENEAVSLQENGHEVFLFCLHYGQQPAFENYHNLHVCRYKSNTLEYKLSALAYTLPFYTIRMAKKIEDFIVEHEIKALHIHDLQIAGAVFKANQKLQLPTVLDLHENRPEIMRFYGHLQKFPGKYIISPTVWKRKEEEFCNKATKIVVVTQEAKKELVLRTKLPKNKFVVVPNTVRKSFYTNTSIQESIVNKYKNNFVLLYIGDTALRRGLLTAIQALKSIKTVIPSVKLVIVGKSKTDEVLKAKVKELGVENYVVFEGWQQPGLFPSYITASSVCISPLHRNLHHDTTYANKLFQYMSMGKALLVSDATAQKNIVENIQSGLVHQEKNVKDFADKILVLAQDKKRRETLAQNGKMFVNNEFSWEHTSKNLLALYKKLDVIK